MFFDLFIYFYHISVGPHNGGVMGVQTHRLSLHSLLITVHLRSPVEMNVATPLSQGHSLAPSSDFLSVWRLGPKYHSLLLQMVGGVQNGCLV